MGKNGKRIDAPTVNSFVVGVGRPKPKAKKAAPAPAPTSPKADDPAVEDTPTVDDKPTVPAN